MEFSAEEVIRQLGGNKFRVMTGARNFVKGKNYIRFKVPNAKKGIKYIKITLNEMDTYNVTFQSRSGKVIKEINDVYNDQLQNVFTSETGLNTHL